MKCLRFSLLMALALLVFSCGGAKKSDDKKAITIGYVDGWAEGVAMTNITKVILEQNGYAVETQKAAVDLIFASMSNGDTDVFMDTWLPVTHGTKVAKFEGKIESIGQPFSNAKIGLVVPSYVTINSIEELNANADKFNGQIIGIERGAGITTKTDLAVEQYNLVLEQMNSSGIAMLSELKKAIDANKWVVVTGWIPHWKFGRYDLKFLDDPKGVYGEAERIETYARKGFKEEDPFAAKYFANFKLDDAQMGKVLMFLNDFADKEEGAKKWVAQNQDLVNSWIQ
ncbi:MULTISPECIES: glycine betaine ABC transporter substrate-binding protein [unclassified Carboxylicivirga]|uniref:glycine betaine ABC transporter substrate-binding protein n=1 Tax=Carboxylicivirga TaxID=1628153 RepID=UPI003D342F20